MKYEYAIVYRIKGIEHKGPMDVELLSNSNSPIRAVLTKKPDKFTGRKNEDVAVWAILANRLEQQGQNLSLVEQMRNATMISCPKFEDVPHIVIQIRGECEELNGKKIISETEDFVAYLNVNDPSESIRSESENVVAAVLTSLVLESGGSIMPAKICDSIALIREDGKRVIPVNFSLTIEVSNDDPLVEDAPVRITDCYHRLSSDKESLGLVAKLLKLSLETEKDKLRSFLFGLSALEIFVNTIFRKYEGEIFIKLRESSNPKLCVSFVDRIREVMKDKYSLTNKFSLVASGLCVADAEKDVEVFQKTKKKRNSLFHGSKINETELPTKSARDLLVKYLQLHLGGALRPATVKTVMNISGQNDPFGMSFKKT
jgi:hypothetical protein